VTASFAKVSFGSKDPLKRMKELLAVNLWSCFVWMLLVKRFVASESWHELTSFSNDGWLRSRRLIPASFLRLDAGEPNSSMDGRGWGAGALVIVFQATFKAQPVS